MPLMIAEVRDETLAEGLIDLFSATWTCSEHGTVMAIETGADCPECAVDGDVRYLEGLGGG